uniref:Uncharacterized protein n=1 Tax=Noctiluca scintillans TaxID=2966 RepID=A0A7S0ZUP5_NOCSC
MASTTSHLIAKFDKVEMKLESIRIAEADHPVRPEDDLLEEELHARCVLRCAEKEISLLEKRIHRHEHPRLFHYFVCGRGSKVVRMRDELRTAALEKERRSADVSSVGAAVLEQRRKQSELSERATRRKQLESESLSLFNSVVDAQPPTAALEQCTTHRQQCITEMVPEQLLLCVLSGHVEGMARGQDLFEQALELYQEALLMGEELQIVTLDKCKAHAGAQTERRLNQQDQMNKVTDAAGMVAMRAYHEVGMVLTRFPQEARTRYPQLCGSLGAIAYPCAGRGNVSETMMNDEFFELPGTATGDTCPSGCEVRDNINSISHCVTITVQHVITLEAVRTAVSSTVDQWTRKISDLDAKIASERNNMFAAVRVSTLAAREP